MIIVVTPGSRPLRAAPTARAVLLASSLAALGIALGGCESDSPKADGTLARAEDPDARLGDGVSAYGMRYPLTAAIGEIWGRSTAYPTHFNVDYLLANGRFAVTSISVDGGDSSVREPVESSVVLRAELYAPDADAFAFADYAFAGSQSGEPEPEEVDGVHFFTAARVGVDLDRSGSVEEEEMRSVIGGTISFEGPVPDIALTFAVTLEDGTSSTGSYRGLFEFIERP